MLEGDRMNRVAPVPELLGPRHQLHVDRKAVASQVWQHLFHEVASNHLDSGLGLGQGRIDQQVDEAEHHSRTHRSRSNRLNSKRR